MSSGKSGGSAKQYNYYGTIAAAFGYGPFDWLSAVICDGKAIWEDTLERGAEDSVDLTGSVLPKYFAVDGYLKWYWGTSTQTLDAALTGQPDYKHIAHLVGKNFLFGLEKSTAPNLEIVGGRLPVCDTSLCAAEDNVADDGQVNPVAVLAELLTSPHGAGQELSRFHAASWADAASWIYDRRGLYFCSPLVKEDLDLRSVIGKLLELIGGTLSWTADGKLALKLYRWGVDPGGLSTLDARHFIGRPKANAGGWSDVPTGFVVRYADRSKKFKEADIKQDNILAKRIRGEHARRNLDFPSLITRRDQAEALAAEAIRHTYHPASGLSATLRREIAVSYRVGDKVKVDVDPEPGGSGLEQLAIIEERRDKGEGDIAFIMKLDPVADSTPYTPVFVPPNPQEADAESIEFALVVPLPPKATGHSASVAIVAARPQADAIGFRVYFDTDSGGDFAELGVQDGFAVRCSLDSSRDEDDTTFTFTLTDGADGPDAYLAGRTAETEIAAATDVLLAVIANVDGNGRVEVDGDGTLEMEVLSIISRSAVDSDTHDYEVLRARKGTAARSWTTDAKVWIIPGADLEAWVHEDMLALLNSGDIGYVQLSTITGYAEDDESLPQFSFVFPGEFKLAPQITWGEPETNPYTLGSSGDLDPTATIDDADGNLVRVELFSVRDDTNLLTKHLDVPFPPTMQQTLGNCFDLANVSGTVNFPGQVSVDTYHTLTLRATDSSGNVIEASVTLIRPATGGGGAGVGGVTYSPTAAESDPPTLVTLTVGGSADRIHYKLDLIGSSAPSSFSTEMDTSVQVSIPSSKRLWARASNGSNHSAWQHQDYQQDFGL